MVKRYFLCERDYEAVKLALDKSGILFKRVNMEKKEDLPYLFVPLSEDKKIVIELDSESLPASINEENEKRTLYLNQLEKAKRLFLKGNLLGLLATFLVLLAVGTGFFAIGFGMKQNAGYYAILVLAIAFLALAFYLIHRGAIFYEKGRERRNNALSLLNKEEK